MSDFYAAVFGAGVCGTAIANTLSEKGKKVLLIDPHVSENAPGAPAGLVNPATGPRAKLCWRGKECYEALRSQLETLADYSGRNDLYLDSGVMRPAITEKLGKNFKKALDKYDWPEGWIQWMDESEISELNSEIAPNFGGLYLKCGLTVYMDRYLNTYRKYLRNNGVRCMYEKANYRVNEGAGNFHVTFEDGSVLSAEHLVVAAGDQTPCFKEWSHLPLEGVKGQIVWFEAEEELDWQHAVSARGYCMRRGGRGLVAGATYEHHFDGLQTTGEAYDTIKNKLEKMLPGIPRKVKKREQLAGVRVTTPNRLPVIGRHLQMENMCVYTGMNSKGLLYSHYVAGLLADHIVAGTSIPEELDADRFKNS